LKIAAKPLQMETWLLLESRQRPIRFYHRRRFNYDLPLPHE